MVIIRKQHMVQGAPVWKDEYAEAIKQLEKDIDATPRSQWITGLLTNAVDGVLVGFEPCWPSSLAQKC